MLLRNVLTLLVELEMQDSIQCKCRNTQACTHTHKPFPLHQNRSQQGLGGLQIFWSFCVQQTHLSPDLLPSEKQLDAGFAWLTLFQRKFQNPSFRRTVEYLNIFKGISKRQWKVTNQGNTVIQLETQMPFISYCTLFQTCRSYFLGTNSTRPQTN